MHCLKLATQNILRPNLFVQYFFLGLYLMNFSCASPQTYVYEDGDRVYYTDEFGHSIRVLPSVFGPSPLSSKMRKFIAYDFQPKTMGVALDIGSGSGIYAYLLAQKGFKKIYATDINPAAISTIKINANNFGYDKLIVPILVDENKPVFGFLTNEKADLVVFNPPWENKPADSLEEKAKYDEDHAFLKKFLEELPSILSLRGEALISLGTQSAKNVFLNKIKETALKYQVVIHEEWSFKKSGSLTVYKVSR
ncbi:MAG: hypothetical protein CME65_11390 [Halobacteriovoraceae bacterium]|nr:hypothetical protein [Halobacteriovoraceae bacterium]